MLAAKVLAFGSRAESSEQQLLVARSFAIRLAMYVAMGVWYTCGVLHDSACDRTKQACTCTVVEPPALCSEMTTLPTKS